MKFIYSLIAQNFLFKLLIKQMQSHESAIKNVFELLFYKNI